MDELAGLLADLEILQFIEALSRNSLELAGEEEWLLLRPLNQDERSLLLQLRAEWDEMEALKRRIQAAFPPSRRQAIRTRRDLTTGEVQLLSRFRYLQDHLDLCHRCLLADLHYEFSFYEEIKLSEDKALWLGRGYNRRIIKRGAGGEEEAREAEWLRSLLGGDLKEG
jgi:hypothetical protein